MMTDEQLIRETSSYQGFCALLSHESERTHPGRGPEGDEVLLAHFREIAPTERPLFWKRLCEAMGHLWTNRKSHAFSRGTDLVRQAKDELESDCPDGTTFLHFLGDDGPEASPGSAPELSLAANALELLRLFDQRDVAFWRARLLDAYDLLPRFGGYPMRRYLHAAWLGWNRGELVPKGKDWTDLLSAMVRGERFYKLEAMSLFNHHYDSLPETKRRVS